MQTQQLKSAVAWLSVLSNTALVAFKLVVGLLIGSVSILSEAIHSGVDLLAAVIALIAVKTSAKPSDEEHPFGHGKIENISGAIEAVLIFLAAAWIIYESVHKLLRPTPIDHAGWGVAVMLISVAANSLVSHALFKVARQTESVALEADAWHLRTDVWTSAGVMAGLLLLWISQRLWPQARLDWIDPVAAIIVALMIVRAAWHLTLQAGRDLIDASLPPEEEAWIREYLTGLSPTVCGFHKLRTRRAGATRFVTVHLQVPYDLTVHESHEMTHRVGQGIKDRLPGTDVTIHIEPHHAAAPVSKP